ncbi:MAG: outer membrane protein assembly factor BamE [Cycloclasticus sp.]|jgi:outer membrane protein assembly factor BamE|nr:outer membrane protein assembly factor BamE [Cycloclasticus sp.]
MRKFLILIMTFITSSFLMACSTTESLNNKMLEVADTLPGVYKIDVHQGNVVTQEMVDQLRPGMDKRQVRFLLGTPLLADPFHKDRWDYFYDLKKSGKQIKTERITVFFEADKLVNLSGNFKPSNEFKPMTINTEVIDVPKREKKEKGWLEKALQSIGIGNEEKI